MHEHKIYLKKKYFVFHKIQEVCITDLVFHFQVPKHYRTFYRAFFILVENFR